MRASASGVRGEAGAFVTEAGAGVAAEPGNAWEYSSATSNILARIVRQRLAESFEAALRIADVESLREHYASTEHDWLSRLSSELLHASGIDYRRVSFEGRSRLAQACGAISLGDYVSFYLAMLYGADPSVTESLTLIKTSMGVFDPSAEDDSQQMPSPDSGTDGSRRLM